MMRESIIFVVIDMLKRNPAYQTTKICTVVLTLLTASCGGSSSTSSSNGGANSGNANLSSNDRCTTGSAPSTLPSSTGAPWALLWNDEFVHTGTGNGVNTNKWAIEDWPSSRNNELQYYAPDDVWVTADGCLRLQTRKRTYTGSGAYAGVTRQYTSGAVNTDWLAHKFSFKYGRIEVRARLPKTKGVWPAHWMLPADGTWPPEIDIMEMLGHEPQKIYMTNHWGTPASHLQNGSFYIGDDFSAGFHVFAVEWEPGVLRWYIDDKEAFSSYQGVPDKPFYILLNTAIGGNWPGNPDATTVLPQFHDIDYVRVYRR